MRPVGRTCTSVAVLAAPASATHSSASSTPSPSQNRPCCREESTRTRRPRQRRREGKQPEDVPPRRVWREFSTHTGRSLHGPRSAARGDSPSAAILPVTKGIDNETCETPAPPNTTLATGGQARTASTPASKNCEDDQTRGTLKPTRGLRGQKRPEQRIAPTTFPAERRLENLPPPAQRAPNIAQAREPPRPGKRSQAAASPEKQPRSNSQL